jgi:hypothetical protein
LGISIEYHSQLIISVIDAKKVEPDFSSVRKLPFQTFQFDSVIFMQHKLWNLYVVAIKEQTHEFLLRDLFHDNASIAGCVYKLSGKTSD